MKTRIRLTAIKVDWKGQMLERYLDQTCFLRTARKVGDEEVVNNFVLGRLNDQKSKVCIDFEKVK